MQVKVTTKMKNYSLRSKRDPVIVITLTIEPRGSGNRNHARRLGRVFETDPIMSDHIAKVICGSSSVHVYLRPSLAAWAALNERITQARENQDAPGQMFLSV